MITVGAFPIGIQPERFSQTLSEAKVQGRIAALEQEFRNKTVMVGVDRLDYMKGVPQKLRAFELFLAEHSEYVGRAVLIQIAIPTRGEVEEYQNLRALVNELVGRINGKFGMWSTTFGDGTTCIENLLATRFVLMYTHRRRDYRIYTNPLHTPECRVR